MSRKASIVWGVVPLSEVQTNFDLKLGEQTHNTETLKPKWWVDGKKKEKRVRHTGKKTVNALVANTGCQQNEGEADWLVC